MPSDDTVPLTPRVPPCLTEIGPDRYRCARYGWTITVRQYPVRCSCPTRAPKRDTPLQSEELTDRNDAGGPGTELHTMLARWGIQAIEGCQCGERIQQMDHWGPAGCREHLDEIVDGLMTEASRRGWTLTDIPGFREGSRFAARRLVLRAIRRAEKQRGR